MATVITLVPPRAQVIGRRPRAGERDWQLLVYVPGQALLVHWLLIDTDSAIEEAQAAAARILGQEVTWRPCGPAWRAEEQDALEARWDGMEHPEEASWDA
jgi:hypothetical protein